MTTEVEVRESERFEDAALPALKMEGDYRPVHAGCF